MTAGDLIQTGITGLDDLVRGGIPKGNVLMVEGASGRRALSPVATRLTLPALQPTMSGTVYSDGLNQVGTDS
jgi:archaellum biogenesis ATPase FlaH